MINGVAIEEQRAAAALRRVRDALEEALLAAQRRRVLLLLFGFLARLGDGGVRRDGGGRRSHLWRSAVGGVRVAFLWCRAGVGWLLRARDGARQPLRNCRTACALRWTRGWLLCCLLVGAALARAAYMA